jgi:hypothetical protein
MTTVMTREVLVSDMLGGNEAYKLRKKLSTISTVSFTRQASDHTVLGVAHFDQIMTTGLESQPFLTISALCLVQMMHLTIDPFTFPHRV